MSRDDVLISSQTLAGSLGDVVVLDVRWGLTDPPGAGRERYLAGHLPGARFLDLESVLTEHGAPTDGRHPLPSVRTLEQGLGALGVDGSRPIVVYDEAGSFGACRAWWVLRWAGLDVRVLDGGIDAWTRTGGPLETGNVPAEPVTVSLATGALPTIEADAAAAWPNTGTLIDARAAQRYRGEVEPMDPKAGHIPGAVNRPVTLFFNPDGTLPDDDTLRELLGADNPATYCGSGVSSAQLVLAGAAIDLPVTLYAGSWSAWSNDESRPVAVGDSDGTTGRAE